MNDNETLVDRILRFLAQGAPAYEPPAIQEEEACGG